MCDTAVPVRSKHMQPAAFITDGRARRHRARQRRLVTRPAVQTARRLFADVRDYTAPSKGALHATSAAELAEYIKYVGPRCWPSRILTKADQPPIMSFVARRFLCVSASSAQSERDFVRPYGDGNAVAYVGWESRSVGAGTLWHASRCSVTMTCVRLSAILSWLWTLTIRILCVTSTACS